MSGKTATGKPRRHPGIAGKRPDGKARRIREAEERRLSHEKEGSPRSKAKRKAAEKARLEQARSTHTARIKSYKK